MSTAYKYLPKNFFSPEEARVTKQSTTRKDNLIQVCVFSLSFLTVFCFIWKLQQNERSAAQGKNCGGTVDFNQAGQKFIFHFHFVKKICFVSFGNISKDKTSENLPLNTLVQNLFTKAGQVWRKNKVLCSRFQAKNSLCCEERVFTKTRLGISAQERMNFCKL